MHHDESPPIRPGSLFPGHRILSVADAAAFYQTAPAVIETGPYNRHFIIDVGFAFLVSAAALAWSAWHSDRRLALIGAAWPLLHGLFHLHNWVEIGLPVDAHAAADWAGVVLPAGLAVGAAYRLKEFAT